MPLEKEVEVRVAELQLPKKGQIVVPFEEEFWVEVEEIQRIDYKKAPLHHSGMRYPGTPLQILCSKHTIKLHENYVIHIPTNTQLKTFGLESR